MWLWKLICLEIKPMSHAITILIKPLNRKGKWNQHPQTGCEETFEDLLWFISAETDVTKIQPKDWFKTPWTWRWLTDKMNWRIKRKQLKRKDYLLSESTPWTDLQQKKTLHSTSLLQTCIRYSRTFRHTHSDVLQNESPVCTLDRSLSFLGTQKLV